MGRKIILLGFLIAMGLLNIGCHQKRKNDNRSYQEMPKKATIYYFYNHCPSTKIGFMDCSPEDFFDDPRLVNFNLLDKESLEFFYQLKIGIGNRTLKEYYRYPDVKFAAIVDYGEKKDSIYLTGAKHVWYNNKVLLDSIIEGFFVEKIYERDKTTGSLLKEYFYCNEFHFITKEQSKLK